MLASFQKFFVIPSDSDKSVSENQSDVHSELSYGSGEVNASVSSVVLPGPSSTPSVSTSPMFVNPKRPASAPSAGEPPCKSTPSGDHFFNKKGGTKKGNNSLLQSAVQAMEKIAAESEVPITIPQLASKQNDFANFVSNWLDALDAATRKLCENEILQVLLKY